MKKGLDFISDSTNKINETNLYKLYQLTIGDFLEDDDKLLGGNFYRHDSVYIMGEKIEYEGLKHSKLPNYMQDLIKSINEENRMNELLEATVIHFYIAHLYPYSDGNGRIARLVHLWYLALQGYSSAMFIPFSKYINESRKGYYNAYTLCGQNAKIKGVLNVTPFISYFIENVYNKLNGSLNNNESLEMFKNALRAGKLPKKKKDFGNAAYATIRPIVMKFENLELLNGQKYGNKIKCKVQ